MRTNVAPVPAPSPHPVSRASRRPATKGPPRPQNETSEAFKFNGHPRAPHLMGLGLWGCWEEARSPKGTEKVTGLLCPPRGRQRDGDVAAAGGETEARRGMKTPEQEGHNHADNHLLINCLIN